MASAEQKENLLTSEMTLRSALQFLNVPGEVIRKADEILSEILLASVYTCREFFKREMAHITCLNNNYNYY